MATAMRAMIKLQEDYNTEKKMGMPGTSKLQKCLIAVATCEHLYKDLDRNRPKIIEADIKPLVDDYNLFLNRCQLLLSAQTLYFKNQYNQDIKRKYQRLEKNMREYLTKFFTGQHQQQQAALF